MILLNGDEVQCWDDRDERGRQFEEKFSSERKARNFVRKIVETNFPLDQYEIREMWTGQKLKWFYKDGD